MKYRLFTALAFFCSATLSCQLKTPASLLEDPNAISFSPAAGTYGASQNISLTSSIAGSTICYSTDGAMPRCAGESGCAAGIVYSSPLAIVAPALAVSTTTVKAVGCKSGTATFPVATSTYVLDTQPPTLVSSTPANSATNVPPCSGAPCVATISLVFSESLNTALVQTLTMEIQDSATPTYATSASAGTTFSFSQTNTANDTLIIHLSWLNFPEMSAIRYTLAASGITDVVGNSIAAQVQGIFTTTTRNVAYPVSDTGLTSCYDDTVAQACPLVTHPRQDGDFSNTPNARSFTGPTAHATFTSDYTTIDNTTGLVWKSCSEGLSAVDCLTGTVSTMTWFDAVNQCSSLNAANAGSGYANRRDWRLATIAEMATLSHYGVVIPSTDQLAFPETVSARYWTSTNWLQAFGSAWNIQFGGGSAGSSTYATLNRVRCVSGFGNAALASYTDNGDGTVSNAITNQVWTKCPVDNSGTGTLLPFASNCAGTRGSRTWSQALNDCNNLTLAGRNWRLPSITEFNGLIARSRYSPAVDSALFPNAGTAFYWTSSTVFTNLLNAWTIFFSTGTHGNVSAKTTSQNVRCVATGP